ncbi:HyaD/HybD family hydrogenase maturation endopeptidase [Desulfobaculum senezii]|uniref:HyaD/HybD family hydrogenase maturation endopeptidase n=1 Tax=Desulfobaculum sp. SPO524 TaxID=3378071 RepID=UPI003852CC87
MTDTTKILVLGCGNILLRDEGIGVRVVERLQEEYEFSDNVQLVDGGVRGLILTDLISQADHVIILDAVINGHEPGTLYRLDGEDLRLSLAFKNSVHDMDLLETLCCCELITGHKPSAIIVGIEPKDYQSEPSLEISEELTSRIPEMMAMAVKEVEAAGGRCAVKNPA